jgi:hypothetical protein
MRRYNSITSVFARLFLFFVFAALAGCVQNSAGALAQQDSVTYSYVGLTLDQARGLAGERQHPFRVVKLDGVDLQVTYDVIPGRINAEVVARVVVAFSVEGDAGTKEPATDNAIGENCLAFFDGCNQCRRGAPGGPAACTRKACAIVEAPYCLDE